MAIFAGLVALIADMFLGWVKVSVYSAALFDTSLTFDMQVTGSGWSGWGVGAGILAVILVLWHARSLRTQPVAFAAAAVTFALAAAIVGLTVWQALTGEADVVSAEGTLFITVNRLWPAEVAIGLSAVVAVASTTRLVTAATRARRRTAPRMRENATA